MSTKTAIDTQPAIQRTAEQIGGLSLEHFPRLGRLRSRLLSATPAICSERARLLTEYFQRQGFDENQPVLRQALALAHVLDHLPAVVFDDELVVGSTTRHRLGCLLFPEFFDLSIWPELATISKRRHDPVKIESAQIDLLAEEVFPFWRNYTVHEFARRIGNDPACLRLSERLVFYALSKINCISHVIANYALVVERGLQAIAEEAGQLECEASDEETAEFHRAVQIVLNAVVRFAAHYSACCDQMAEAAAAERATELRSIARMLRRVPAAPARSLHEALQAIWITHVALHQENYDAAISFGRLDQILHPFYEADLAEGHLDTKRAAELVGCFFMKMCDHAPLVPSAGQELVGGTSTNQAVTIGGTDAAGSDAVTRTTYLLLDVASMLALREPNLCARIHSGSGSEYRHALIDSIQRSGAAPALYNDDAVVAALTKHGVSLTHARDYAIVGCVEPTSSGRTMGMTGAILFNLASVLELALNDGIHPLSGLRVGPETGLLKEFSSFDKVREAFRLQLEALVAYAAEGNALLGRAHAAMHPTPLLSALIDGTAESGRDVTRGGALYNSSGVAVIGLADVVDSLSALRHLVFESRKLSMAEVAEALAVDFVGHDKTRALLSHKAPKYGTDSPQVDQLAADIVEQVADAFGRHQTPRGGRYHLGYWSMTLHAGLGALVGSLPNGRQRKASLASGATPASGAARKGPTASLASTARLPAQRMANGIANNHKFSRSLLADTERRRKVARLVEVYFARGGMQVQFTVQDQQTLLAAQADPNAYRDLLVRVSGYSAYFCDLTRRMQDEIISRTENAI